MKRLIFLLLFFLSVSYATRVAIIADATGSLYKYGILEEYKRNIKAIIEILSVLYPGVKITLIRFGDDDQAEIVIDNYIKDFKTLPYFLKKVDKYWQRDKLFWKNTSFYSGFKKLLEKIKSENSSYDITIFISDGGHNTEKTPEDLLEVYRNLILDKKLGSIFFVFVKPKNREVFERYKNVILEWARVLKGDVIYNDVEGFTLQIVKHILKNNIKDFIIGYGLVSVKNKNKVLRIRKYKDDTELRIIVYPSASIKVKGANVYNGNYISYASINSKAKNYSVVFPFSGYYYILYYETTGYSFDISLEPKRPYYFAGETLKFNVRFLVNNKEIKDELFLKTLKVQLKIGDEIYPVKTAYEIKHSYFPIKDTGTKNIFLRFSPFEDELLSKEFNYVGSIKVLQPKKYLEISVDKPKIYEYQKFKLIAKLKGLYKVFPKNIPILLRKDDGSIKKVELKRELRNVYSGTLRLGAGNYVIQTATKEIIPILKGNTLEVLRRRLVIRVEECGFGFSSCKELPDGVIKRYLNEDVTLSIPFPIRYSFIREFVKVVLSIEPYLGREDLILKAKFLESGTIKLQVIGDYYPIPYIIPVSFGERNGVISINLKEINQLGSNFTFNFIVQNHNAKLKPKLFEGQKKLGKIEFLNYEDGERVFFTKLYISPELYGVQSFNEYRRSVIIRDLFIIGSLFLLFSVYLYTRRRQLLKRMVLINEILNLNPYESEYLDKLPPRARAILLNNDITTLKVDEGLQKELAKILDLKFLQHFKSLLTKPTRSKVLEIKPGESVIIDGYIYNAQGGNEKAVSLRDKSMKNYRIRIEVIKSSSNNRTIVMVEDLSNAIGGARSVTRDDEFFFGNYKVYIHVSMDKAIVKIIRV